MKTILIVGMGQIGRSIYELYEPLKDKYRLFYVDANNIEPLPGIANAEEVDDFEEIDYMHVCIPYNAATFVLTVEDYIRQYLPAFTMIHSTVDIGTTRKIYDDMGAPVCHSPVMGVHPKLTEGIKTFEKILGCINTEHTKIAVDHLHDANIKVAVYSNPENSEAAKLLDTTYYGWNIIFMKDVHKFCAQYQLDFDEVYKATNEIYNRGYEKLGMSNVIRPVLKFVPQKIGGHCVIPNCRIIRKYFYPAAVIIDKDNNDN